MGIPHSLFEEKLETMKEAKGAKLDTDLTASDLKELVELYKNVYLEAKGESFPSGKGMQHSIFPTAQTFIVILLYPSYVIPTLPFSL